MKRIEAIQSKANVEADRLMRIIVPLMASGQGISAIAKTLDTMNVQTSQGDTCTAKQVSRFLERVGG